MKWSWTLFFSLSALAWAGLGVRKQTQGLFVNSTCAEAGVIKLKIDGDDFAAASPATPIYLRLQFDLNTLLCSTLVDYDQAGSGHFHEPIYLPLWLESGDPQDTLVAPVETAAIIRWIQGEQAIWLRIQSSSSSWIATDSGNTSPSIGKRVFLLFGVSARASWERHASSFQLGHANLPAPTRDTGGTTMEDAVSTLLCLDLTQSDLEPLPEPAPLSLQTYNAAVLDHLTMGVTTVADPGLIVFGNQLATIIGPSTGIGVGIADDCTSELPNGGGMPAQMPLCLEPGASSSLIQMSNQLAVTVTCANGWGFHRNSRVVIDLPAGARHGFLVDLDQGGTFIDAMDVSGRANTIRLRPGALDLDIPASTAYADLDAGLVAVDGHFLARNAEVLYLGDGMGGAANFSLESSLSTYFDEAPVNVDLAVTIHSTNRDGAADEDPLFQGPEQSLHCAPVSQPAASFNWAFGSFTACPFLNFPGPNFKTFLVEQFDQDLDGELTAAEAQGVTAMDCGGRDIANIRGIRHFTNLQQFLAAGNRIESLGDLTALTQLGVLHLQHNLLTVIEPVAAVPFLGTQASHQILFDHNLLEDSAAVCADIQSLQNHMELSGAQLVFNPQGDPLNFRGSVQDWPASDVLNLIAIMNFGQDLLAEYTICTTHD